MEPLDRVTAGTCLLILKLPHHQAPAAVEDIRLDHYRYLGIVLSFYVFKCNEDPFTCFTETILTFCITAWHGHLNLSTMNRPGILVEMESERLHVILFFRLFQ